MGITRLPLLRPARTPRIGTPRIATIRIGLVSTVASALAVTLLGTAPSAGGSPAPVAQAASAPVAQAASAPGQVSVLSTGATRGDGSDDLAAFQEAVRRAQAAHRDVFVPPGTYHLSGVLVLDGVRMRGAGRRLSLLVSTNPSAGSIDLIGRRPGLFHLSHVVENPVGRSPEPGRQNINVKYATGFRVVGVHAVGARGAGMLIRKSHYGVVRHSIVEKTLADGIHMTGDSSNIVVRHNLSRETGDDGIAVVSYKNWNDNDGHTRKIQIRRNRVIRGKARGITVVGGVRVTIADNVIRNTESGGIYIAAEREWTTRGVYHVWVSRNRVVGLPTRNSHASILVYSSREMIDRVFFRNNTVIGATNVGYGVWLHPDGSGQIGRLFYRGNVNSQLASSAWARTRFETGKVYRYSNRGF